MKSEHNREILSHPKFPFIWKLIILYTALFLLVLTAFAWYINMHWRPFISQQIQEAVLTSTDSLYKITYKNIDINILTGSATLEEISLNPDTQVYSQLITMGKAPRHLFKIKVAQLNLNNVRPWKVYFQKALTLKSIIVENPELEMIYQQTTSPQDTLMDKRSAYQRLSKYLRSIKVESIIFKDADFKYVDKSALNRQITPLKNLNIHISGLLIDSLSQYDKTKFFYTRDISVSLYDYTYQSQDKMYDFKLEEFTASTAKKYVMLKGFNVIPRYEPMEFSKKFTERRERYSMRFDEVLLENINYRMFINQRKLKATKLTVSNSLISVFLNSQLPKSTQNKMDKFPQRMLQNFNLNTLVDTVSINNMQLRYSEFNPVSQRIGTIYFNEIKGNLLNLTNDPASLRKNHHCKAEFTCLLMARGRLNLSLDFNLRDKNSTFSYQGMLGILKLPVLNRVIKPLALVEIRSGLIKDMVFNGAGNANGNNGKLALRYTNLKIKLLQKNENDTRLKTMSIATMAANILVLEGDNPSAGQKLRIGYYNYKRPYNASFFSLLWKGLFVGIQESVGLDEKTQRKIVAKMKQFKSEKFEREQRKTDRSERREKREKRP